jgi:acetyltransferase-like isoleucine patch superfamily enzyme
MLKCLVSNIARGYRLPKACAWLVRLGYRTCAFVAEASRQVAATWIVAPIVQSLAKEFGRHVSIERIPYIWGKGDICLGNNVCISGKISIAFARRDGNPPKLVMGNSVFVGHDSAFMLARAITIGDFCLLGGGVRIQDNDGHPLDPVLRQQHEKVADEDIAPVVLGRNVWVGARATILKGVTIGDNAVVGTGSIVTKDVPSNTVVAGNPARVIRELGSVESGL